MRIEIAFAAFMAYVMVLLFGFAVYMAGKQETSCRKAGGEWLRHVGCVEHLKRIEIK